MNAPLDSFETALLTQLREHTNQEATTPARRFRPRLLIAAAATVAAAAAILVVVPGLGSTAAYSVTEGNSGTITVEVHRLQDAAGLEAALGEYGITADITYVPGQQECAPGRYTPVGRSLSGMGIQMGADLLRVTLPPGTVRDGETFVMAVSGEAIPPSTEPSQDGVRDMGGFSSWADFNVTVGPMKPCTVVSNTFG